MNNIGANHASRDYFRISPALQAHRRMQEQRTEMILAGARTRNRIAAECIRDALSHVERLQRAHAVQAALVRTRDSSGKPTLGQELVTARLAYQTLLDELTGVQHEIDGFLADIDAARREPSPADALEGVTESVVPLRPLKTTLRTAS